MIQASLNMKNDLWLLCICFVFFTACQSQEKSEANTQNEVLVLGMIHGGHLIYEEYSVEVLTDLIRKINPDVILTEIPPDRFPQAIKEFEEADTVTEARVARFPEYVDVIFPLSKEMDFELVPTAAWTQEMAAARGAKLKEIREDPNRADDMLKFTNASITSDSLLELSGLQHSPYFINSSEYDSILEIQLSVYNELFNDDLGLGGWDNINEAHYAYIEKALNRYQNQGKRILITYGAGHKGWFLRALKKRTDIQLLTLEEAVKPKVAQNQ